MIKQLYAATIPFSSNVGGGISLRDKDKGVPLFQLAFIGTRNGISKEQTESLANQIAKLINEHGVSVNVNA